MEPGNRREEFVMPKFWPAAALLLGASIAHASTTVVTPDNLGTPTDPNSGSGWFFYNDETDTIDNTLGTFVTGPGNPPLGRGSAQISVSGTQRRNLATYQFSGTPLADITELKFSTYNPSMGNSGSAQRSAYLNFNVDFNGSDTWQRRLVFVPSVNGTVIQDHWQEWDAIASGNALWSYSGSTWPVTGGSGNTPKTWAQILADYPGVRIRVTDSWLGLRVGEPYPDGYTDNLDAFKFATGGGEQVFDFEATLPPPTDKDQCKDGGWETFTDPPYRNQGDCISDVLRRSRD
jgi:hypothetical protein